MEIGYFWILPKRRRKEVCEDVDGISAGGVRGHDGGDWMR